MTGGLADCDQRFSAAFEGTLHMAYSFMFCTKMHLESKTFFDEIPLQVQLDVSFKAVARCMILGHQRMRGILHI